MTAAFVAVSAGVLLWDVVLAGQIARLRSAPRVFAGVTALVGLLALPAVLVGAASGSILSGRAIHTVAWVWPATTALFAVQALYATLRRLVSPLIGVPIAAYNIVLALASVTAYVVTRGSTPPQPLLALSAAHTATLGYALGPAALSSPLALQVPLLSPAYPARWRLSKTVRATLAALAAASVGMTLVELPKGVQTIASYHRFADALLRERPGGFAVGLKIFPDLDDVPPPLAVRGDLDLVDSTDVDAVMIVVNPATPGASLDSLGTMLEELRRDSTPLLVSLGYEGDARARYRASPRAYMDRRLNTVEQVVRRLRPDYLFPAHEPYGRGARALGRLPADEWTRYLTAASRRAHRLRPRTRVGVLAAEYDASDSVLYAWAVRAGSPIDVVGFSIVPSFRGGLGVQARTQAADRWLRAAGPTRKEHWVAVAGYPTAHGEQSQADAIWGALAWATNRPTVTGLIVLEAGDYDEQEGLRVPGGRLRVATRSVTRALRGLRESENPLESSREQGADAGDQ